MKKSFLILFTLLFVLFSCNLENKKTKIQSETFEKPQLTEAEIQNGILTPEILWKYGRVGDAQVSPDKTKIIYNITYYHVADNSNNTQIYLVDNNEANEPQQITDFNFSCFNPRWIDDNTIAFLSTETEKSEIWTINLNSKEKVKISNFDNDINSFEFSPDKSNILFTSDVKLDENPQDVYPDLPNTNVIIATDLMYRHWNAWADYAYSHIFIGHISNNSLNSVTDIMESEKFDSPLSPYFDVAEISWSNDSKFIAYTCKKMSGKEYALSTNSDVYLYDIENKTTKNLTEGMLGYDKCPIFSPDSKKIAWCSMKTPGYESDKNRLFIMDMENNEKQYLTEAFDYNANSILWSDLDPNKIFFLSELEGTDQIFEIKISTKEIKQITNGWHDYTSIMNGENGTLVGMKMSMKQATEIYKISSDGQETQLTFTNKNIYDKIKICDVAQKWVTTTDNKKMLVWMIFPPDFDSTKIYPALLYCEGGPQSQVSQFFSFRWNFQIMASNGYVIIAPNRRGLPGFGTEWNAQISGDYGGQNMKDYISAVESCKKAPYIDENKIGAIGASYGGFSVFWLAGHNENKLFKAFISHCGMFNLESQYGETEELFFVNHDLGGPYWDKNNKIAQKSYETSPHHFVQNWNTPILIISGGNDFRIPYTESLQAFNCAQMNGVESKLLIFPEESHFVLKPQNSILWQREFKNWLDIHLK
ncbi:MAG: S9 family peptidase [Bacteroidales bacterium]|jgi:dipeptidyl aminopeptidase/acylaminoacyl peptidase|nr:S9 family peptidase [Bacteroidales bacterium]